MKKILFAIYNLEKSIWGEEINPNKYLATATILFATCLGAYLAGGEYLNDLLNWYINTPTLTASLSMLTVLIGYNVTESIIATSTAKVAVLRALMMTGFVILAFIVGAVASFIILLIITIIVVVFLVITFIKILLNEMTGTKMNGKKFILSDGTIIKKRTPSGDLIDETGGRWKDLGDGHVEKL